MDTEIIEMIKLADEDFKTTFINMFKELKETMKMMRGELEES